MKEYIEIGSCPNDENPVYVWKDYPYWLAMQFEARVYRRQLAAHLSMQFPNWQATNTLRLHTNPHDWGSYIEVAIHYDPNNELSTEIAFWLEANAPEKWDELSKATLQLNSEWREFWKYDASRRDKK